ncbi:carboxypeptidase B-like protein, partial [Dinothrombium tinctorium]
MKTLREKFSDSNEIKYFVEPFFKGQGVLLVSEAMLAKLEQSGFQLKILNENFQRTLDFEQLSLKAKPYSTQPDILSDFLRHDDINNFLNNISANNPTLASTESIGQSCEKRDIRVIIIGNGHENKTKPAIWIDAGIHAREWGAPSAALFIINQLINGYYNDSNTKMLVDEYDFYILPTKAFTMSTAIAETHGRLFQAGPPPYVIYPAAGSSLDWVYGVCSVNYSYAFELRPVHINFENRVNETCEEAVKRIDKYGEQLYKYEDCNVSNHNHVLAYCKSVQSAAMAIDNYAKKCLKPFPSQLMRILIDDFLKSKLDICGNERRKGKLALWKLERPKKLDLKPLNECMNKFINNIVNLRDNVADIDLKFPYLCCSFYDYKRCVIKETAEDAEDVEFLKQNTETAAVGTFNFVCRFTPENAEICKNFPQAAPNILPPHKSIIIPLIDIYNSLNDA